MKIFIINIFLIIFLLFEQNGYAQNQPLYFKEPGIFLLHNTGSGMIILNHQRIPPGASAGWSSKLGPNKWSALMLNQSDFTLSCLLYLPPRITYINCQDSITVLPLNRGNIITGSYWLAENKDYTDLIQYLKSRGITA